MPTSSPIPGRAAASAASGRCGPWGPGWSGPPSDRADEWCRPRGLALGPSHGGVPPKKLGFSMAKPGKNGWFEWKFLYSDENWGYPTVGQWKISNGWMVYGMETPMNMDEKGGILWGESIMVYNEDGDIKWEYIIGQRKIPNGWMGKCHGKSQSIHGWELGPNPHFRKPPYVRRVWSHIWLCVLDKRTIFRHFCKSIIAVRAPIVAVIGFV